MIGRRSAWILAFLLVLPAILPPPARAEQRSLKPIYDWVIEVSGVSDKGWRVLAPPQQRNELLLISPPGDQALLVSVPEKSVRPVDRSLLMRNSDGTTDILAGAVSRTRIIPLLISGATATFSVDGREIALKPRPPLLGQHTVADLVADRPDFGDGIKSYQPDAEAVSFLKKVAKPTEIEVFFGSWCGVCETWVPKLLKSLQQAGNSKIQYSLIGVARDFSTNVEIAKQKGVRGLPTFIIRQEGIEVGRIVGAPDKGTVEAAVADLLRARTASSRSRPRPVATTRAVAPRPAATANKAAGRPKLEAKEDPAAAKMELSPSMGTAAPRR